MPKSTTTLTHFKQKRNAAKTGGTAMNDYDTFLDPERDQFMRNWAYHERIDRENESKHNCRLIRRCGKNAMKEFEDVVSDVIVSGRIETTKRPEGSNEFEFRKVFKEIRVDQWSVGDSGDSWAGFIYARYSKRRWLKIPYYC